MNNIQMKGVDSSLSQVILKDIHYLKQHLNEIFSKSDQALIENLIEETRAALEQTLDSSKTYQEKYSILNQITTYWFDVWKHYGSTPEAAKLIQSINHFTDFTLAYSYLFLSLSNINEGRVGEHKADLERIVSGFLLLSEIVDVFVDFFSISELNQVCEGAKNAILVSTRDVKEYFEDELESSHLVTQLKAYSSLIVLKVEEHLKKNEQPKATTTENLHRSSGKLRVNKFIANTNDSEVLRPFGLCAGEFVVPKGFDDPLPEDILIAFEGK